MKVYLVVKINLETYNIAASSNNIAVRSDNIAVFSTMEKAQKFIKEKSNKGDEFIYRVEEFLVDKLETIDVSIAECYQCKTEMLLVSEMSNDKFKHRLFNCATCNSYGHIYYHPNTENIKSVEWYEAE